MCVQNTQKPIFLLRRLHMYYIHTDDFKKITLKIP